MSLFDSKLGQVGKGAAAGFAMGGPLGAVIGGLASSNQSSPASKAMGLAGSYTELDNAFGSSQDPTKIDGSHQVDYDPMQNRMNQNMNNPMSLAHQGLSYLQDPSVPQEYRDALAPQLLQIKHFGQVGMPGQDQGVA